MKNLLTLAALTFALAGCGAETPTAPSTASHDAGKAPPATATADALASLPEPARAPFSTMMTSYDAIHDALAKDTIDGVAATATAIATAASAIEATAPEASKAHWHGVADAAAILASSSGEITKARESFSELNRALITVLVANPDLAKGRVVIECPMWKGYRKWVQTDDKVRNPFYGNSMLECGTKSELKV